LHQTARVEWTPLHGELAVEVIRALGIVGAGPCVSVPQAAAHAAVRPAIADESHGLIEATGAEKGEAAQQRARPTHG
jgi:hypothetical protein